MVFPTAKQRKKRIALAQFLIFSLFQAVLLLTPLSPLLGGREAGGGCRGDHALCGCAPARIAAGTCCCLQSSLPPCCQKEPARPAATAEQPVCTSLPCGTDDPAIAASIDAFLLTTISLAVSTFDSPLLPHAVLERDPGRASAPPDQPPETACSA